MSLTHPLSPSLSLSHPAAAAAAVTSSRSGLSPAQSEFNYLNTARTLELYGVELHYARVSKLLFPACQLSPLQNYRPANRLSGTFDVKFEFQLHDLRNAWHFRNAKSAMHKNFFSKLCAC